MDGYFRVSAATKPNFVYYNLLKGRLENKTALFKTIELGTNQIVPWSEF